MQYWQPMQVSALWITTPVAASLRVRLHRAADQAGRLQAMIAAHREVITLRVWIVPAFHLTHAPPVDRRRVAVLFIARDHAALAADALRHVEVKAVLLAGFERTRGNQRLRRGFNLDQRLTACGGDDVD